MKFAAPGELYEHTYPFVRTELERLQSLQLLKPDSIPGIFRTSNRRSGTEGYSIDEVTERISAYIRDIFFANTSLNIDILASNTAFWVQHLLKNPGRHLRMFDPHAKENKVVPVRPNTHIPIPKLSVHASYLAADLAERFPIFKQFFSHAKLDAKLWRRYVENLDEVGKQFEVFRESIERGEKNIFVVTNHITWANIPFLAFCFHYFLGIPKEKLYAMVGPAIFTSDFEFEGARRWMNLILTWPDTEKGDTGYGQADRVQRSALKNTLRIMRDVSDEVRVIFLAPSGTSDKIQDGKCMMAYPSPGTMSLMGAIGSQYPIFPIGVNDSEIMDPQGIPKKGEVHLRIGEPIEPPVADSIVILKLPGLVIGRNGENIGEWYYPKGTLNPTLDYGNDA